MANMKSSILTIFSGHFSQVTENPPLPETILYPGSHTQEPPEEKKANALSSYIKLTGCNRILRTTAIVLKRSRWIIR